MSQYRYYSSLYSRSTKDVIVIAVVNKVIKTVDEFFV